MRFHQRPDFGNTIVHLGEGEPDAEDRDIDSETEKRSPQQRQSDDPGKDQGLCSKEMCGGMAQAATAALNALGPAGKKTDPAQMAALASDKSPAGQAAYQAALAHDAEVDRQNAERKAIIDSFVKDAIGGNITPEQIALGDAAKAQYEKLVAKYGEKVRGMTLNEVLAAYPEDSKAVITSLAQVFPGLRGKSFDQVVGLIPDAMKNMTMQDLEGAIPNSSWKGTKTSSGQVIGGTTLAIGGAGLLLVAALGFFIYRSRKGASNAPRT